MLARQNTPLSLLFSFQTAISATGMRPRRNLRVASVPRSSTLNLGTRNRLPITSSFSRPTAAPLLPVPPRRPMRGFKWAMSLLEASTTRMPLMLSGSRSTRWLLDTRRTVRSGNASLSCVPGGSAEMRLSSRSASSSSFIPLPASPMYDSPTSWLCARDRDNRLW
ncbi:hypothetical protein RB595_000447 [Gaeumannomyces hyphopodioides]